MRVFFKAQSALRGFKGERYAMKEYKKNGFTILESNVFNLKGKRLGEIDFVAKDKNNIVFVEVKTRATENDRFGGPLAAVNRSKQSKILKAVRWYLAHNPKYSSLFPRIDVCAVIWPELDKRPESVKIITNAVSDLN